MIGIIDYVDSPFCPFNTSLSALSVLHSSLLVAHGYSYNLLFLAISETLVEGFI